MKLGSIVRVLAGMVVVVLFPNVPARAGEEVTYKADELLAIAFQHEIAHLDGILFIDHLSPLKRGIFRKRYLRAQEDARESY